MNLQLYRFHDLIEKIKNKFVSAMTNLKWYEIVLIILEVLFLNCKI